MIEREDVIRAAGLARIPLSEPDVERLASELERVVGYVEQLMAVDVDAVEPMMQPATLPCPRRPDEASPVIGHDALVGSAGFADGLVRVPRVVE